MRRRWSRSFVVAWLVFVGITLATGTCRSELIYFRNGDAVQLPARVEGNVVVLSLPEGTLDLNRADIRKLVPGFWPAAEWGPRRQQAQMHGVEGRFAAAWWAIENGLTTEVVPELRDLRAKYPAYSPTARMVAALDRLDEPCQDANFDRFQTALGVATSVARGPHVILLHQHSDAEAAERIALLERVIAGYHLFFAAQGITLTVPKERLVSAWFADQKSYLAFLRSENAEAFASTRGYFHPTWKAVVAYDARSAQSQRAARDKLAMKRDELEHYRRLVSQAPARSRIKIKLGGEPMRTVSREEANALMMRIDVDIKREAMLLDLDQRSIDLGTAAHEMIHQLASETGLLRQHDMFPVWLHEGLAAQFEVIRGGRWAGISRAHDLRLPDWRRLQNPIPLERLVRNAGFGHGYQRDLYAQAWALVYFLRTQHPLEFLTFIDLLRGSSPRGTSPALAEGDRVFDAFRRAFGADLEKLDREWRRFMANVQTPLEKWSPSNPRVLKQVRPAQPG